MVITVSDLEESNTKINLRFTLVIKHDKKEVSEKKERKKLSYVERLSCNNQINHNQR